MGANHSNEKKHYKEERVLGEGMSCKVLLVVDKKTKSKYALKVLKRTKANKVMFKNEVKLLKMLNHPNILELVHSFEDKSSYNLLTPLCEGGELFDRVVQGKFTEKVASALTKQMLLAIQACHKSHVVHRDLKPENFVFESPELQSCMKLIDFGSAKHVQDNEKVTDTVGSVYYIAPEILSSKPMDGEAWKAADMWSVGIILFLFVCGYPPFNGATQEQTFAKIRRGKVKFPKRVPGQTKLSDSVKDLISKLLVKDGKGHRLTADEALQHPWIAGDTASDEIISAEVINNLHDFHSRCKLKQVVGRVLTNNLLTHKEKKEVEKLFKKYDTNGDGKLDADELAKMMKELHWSEDVRDLIEAMDEDGDGNIDLAELEHAEAVNHLGHVSDAQLKQAFRQFDLNNDGFVSAKEIEQVCHDFMDAKNVVELIKEVDADGDGQINLEEWLGAMRGKLPGNHDDESPTQSQEC